MEMECEIAEGDRMGRDEWNEGDGIEWNGMG
jgi:hypothetical protein